MRNVGRNQKTKDEKSSELIQITLGADKTYQTEKLIKGLRERKVCPHIAEYEPNPKWPKWLIKEERGHPGFSISQQKRKLGGESFRLDER